MKLNSLIDSDARKNFWNFRHIGRRFDLHYPGSELLHF